MNDIWRNEGIFKSILGVTTVYSQFGSRCWNSEGSSNTKSEDCSKMIHEESGVKGRRKRWPYSDNRWGSVRASAFLLLSYIFTLFHDNVLKSVISLAYYLWIHCRVDVNFMTPTLGKKYYWQKQRCSPPFYSPSDKEAIIGYMSLCPG